MNQLLQYTLQIADNALINGHRLSEWCGHGPVLEQDIALSNIALDHLGQSRSLFQYAAEQINKMPSADKSQMFNATVLNQKIDQGEMVDEDDLAYLRDGWDFRNVLLVEQPNKDWANTVARSFYFDTFNYFFFDALQNSNDETIAAIAEKSLKEVTYHIRWSSEWVIRLGDGTAESQHRMQEALNNCWMYVGELFKANEVDILMFEAGIGVDLEAVEIKWIERINAIIKEATLTIPTNSWMQDGGKEGKHTEHLGYILTELQFMQRAYPNMKW